MRKKTAILGLAASTLFSLYSHYVAPEVQQANPSYTINFVSLGEMPSPPEHLYSTLDNSAPSEPPKPLSPLEKCLTHPNAYFPLSSQRFNPLPKISHLDITRPLHSYGRRELIEALDFAGCVMFETYDTPLRINDLSKRYGGRLYPHKSHRMGIDADVGIYTYNPQYGYDNINQSLVYGSRFNSDFSNKKALEANWTFVKHLVDGPADVPVIMLDRRLIATLRNYVVKHHGQEEWEKYNRFRHEPGHKNHYHVRVRPTKKNSLT